MLVLCLNYATIQGGTPPPHFTLSSLDQQGHCRKADYSKFLMQSNSIACVPFCFISAYKSLRVAGTYYPHQNIIIYCCPLLTVMLINYLILLLYPMLRRQRASKQVYKSKLSSGNYTIFGADEVLFIECKQSWEGSGQFFLLGLINSILP